MEDGATRRALLLLLPMLCPAICPSPALAQPKNEWRTVFGQVAGGYTAVPGDSGDSLDAGLYVNGGVMVGKRGAPVAFVSALSISRLDMKREALFADGEPIASSGDVDVFSLTAGLNWTAPTRGRVGFFLSGGLGAYYVRGRLTDPDIWSAGSCDPANWWCDPAIAVGDLVIASDSGTKLGWNAGAGVTFDLSDSSQIFFEASYHRVDTKMIAEYLPIVIG